VTKTNFARWFRAVSSAVLLAGVGLWSAGCAVEEPAYPPGPYGYYDYYYYPDDDVYFYPPSGFYFWFGDGYWHRGHHLPHGYRLHEEHREPLHLHSPRPWTEHRGGHEEFHGEPGHDHGHE